MRNPNKIAIRFDNEFIKKLERKIEKLKENHRLKINDLSMAIDGLNYRLQFAHVEIADKNNQITILSKLLDKKADEEKVFEMMRDFLNKSLSENPRPR